MRWVMHVDMDAFFASVEQRDHEAYRGKPVIVGGLSSRGVVATASYEARKFGVHSAMAMNMARRLCPQGIFLAGRHAHYRSVSRQIFAIFSRFSPRIEPLSIDEAFLDLTGMEGLMQNPHAYALQLKKAIFSEVGLVASVGVAPNKFLAKLASDLEKPNGLVLIFPADIQRVLSPLSVRRLWGVGKKTAQRLEQEGIFTIGQLAEIPLQKLAGWFGPSLAQQMCALAKGQDEREVEVDRMAQSIGKEVTFAQDLQTQDDIERELLSLAERVGWRLRREGKKARTLQLKVRFADFTTCTRRRTLSDGICYDEEIYRVAVELFKGISHAARGIRLLGISGSHFAVQETLFAENEKQVELYQAIDALKGRFGEGVIHRLGAKKEP